MQGTYVEFPMTPTSTLQLVDFVARMGLPSPTHDFHVTTVYSRVPVEYEASNLIEVVAAPQGYVLLQGNNDLGICLALLVYSPEFNLSWKHARHLGATWDYPDFTPHVTLAYGLSIETILNKLLYVPPFNLEFSGEVVKELDVDWTPTKAVAQEGGE